MPTVDQWANRESIRLWCELNLLANEQFGEGVPQLAIIHGLFGSGRNWRSIAKALSTHGPVLVPDLRNHGGSFHHPDMAYVTMADDVARMMDAVGVEAMDLMGHSLGGKVAMTFALKHPKRVRRLIVVDIAPVSYSPRHDVIITSMLGLDCANIDGRDDADALLADGIPEPTVRRFILTNLIRGATGGFQWRVNLDAIAASISSIAGFPELKASWSGPSLFIAGANSDYLTAEHREAVIDCFPGATVIGVPDAGHWLHFDQPKAFIGHVTAFLG